MRGILSLLFAFLGVALCCPGPLLAEYTLLLKNGRRITVQSYREEDGMIKFSGYGGEIAITKEQIQSILPGGTRDAVAVHAEVDRPTTPASTDGPKKDPGGADRPAEPAAVPNHEERLAVERAKEEKEYQKKIRELTERIKALEDRYAVLTRGSSSTGPNLFTSEEAFRGHQDDLVSRLRDAQHSPGGPSDAKPAEVLTSSPFSGVPPNTVESSSSLVRPGGAVSPPLPDYSARQKELSELRNENSGLRKAREKLIDEMKAKDFDTGSLFLN